MNMLFFKNKSNIRPVKSTISKKTLHKINQIDQHIGPTGFPGPIFDLLENYKYNKLELNNNKCNFNINLENNNPHINLTTDKLINDYYSYIEMNNNKSIHNNLFTSIGLYMIQTDNSNRTDTFLHIEDLEKEDNYISILNTKKLSFDDNTNNIINYNKSGINIKNKNKLELTVNNLKFNTTCISHLNKQIVFNNSHIDKGFIYIDSINSSIISFTNMYPINYTPIVILRLLNTHTILPLLVTNITNINFSWYSDKVFSGNISWIAY